MKHFLKIFCFAAALIISPMAAVAGSTPDPSICPTAGTSNLTPSQISAEIESCLQSANNITAQTLRTVLHDIANSVSFQNQIGQGLGTTGLNGLLVNFPLPASAIPFPSTITLGGVYAVPSPTAHNFLTGLSIGGVFTAAQPSASDLSNGLTGSGNVVLGTSPSISNPTISGTISGTAIVPLAALITQSTTVNGQTCTLGGTCTITTAAGSIVVGTTAISGGTSNGLLFDNAGVLGNLATANNAVISTNGSGVPSASTTLPNGLAIGTPASLTLTNATGLPLASGISGFGTNIAAALAANLNASGGIISPSPTRAGDVSYWNGTAWTALAGNNSGTNCLSESSSGVPAWATCGGGSVTAGAGLANGSGNAATGQTISTLVQIYDPTRRNIIIDHVNIAKALGTAQRYVEEFSDGFADATGINAGSSSNYTLATSTKTVSPTSSAGTPVLSAGTTTVNTQSGAASDTVRINIAASALSNTGNPFTIVNFKAGPSAGVTYGTVYVGAAASTGSYAFATTPAQCFFSGSSPTSTLAASATASCTASFTIPASGDIVVAFYVGLNGNSGYGTLPTGWQGYFKNAGSTDDSSTVAATGYTSYGTSLVGVTTVQSAPALINNMTLVSASQTADATVSNARAAIIINSSVSPTWGTSDTMEVTCNGGTNWQVATPVNGGVVQAGSSQSGGNIWEIPDTACAASGTSFALRYKTLTNVARTIYGMSTAVH